MKNVSAMEVANDLERVLGHLSSAQRILSPMYREDYQGRDGVFNHVELTGGLCDLSNTLNELRGEIAELRLKMISDQYKFNQMIERKVDERVEV